MNTETQRPASSAAAHGSARVGNCPLEQRIAKALDTAKLGYRTDYEGGVEAHLDFYVQKYDVHIEVKGGHSPRISKQMARSKNVIVAQGEKAAELLAALIEQNVKGEAQPPCCSVSFSDCVEALNNYGNAEREFGALGRPVNEEDREKVRLAKIRVLQLIDLISRPNSNCPEKNSE